VTEPLTYTVEEAGRLCGVSRQLAYAAVRAGEIPAVRIGRRWVVPCVRLHAMLGDESPTNGEGPATNGTSAKLRDQDAPHGSYPE
jgi:excisionase family DNA binding protein